MGAILKDRVEKRITNAGELLEYVLQKELQTLEFDVDLFVSLLDTYPARLAAVRKAGGGHTRFWISKLTT